MSELYDLYGQFLYDFCGKNLVRFSLASCLKNRTKSYDQLIIWISYDLILRCNGFRLSARSCNILDDLCKIFFIWVVWTKHTTPHYLVIVYVFQWLHLNSIYKKKKRAPFSFDLFLEAIYSLIKVNQQDLIRTTIWNVQKIIKDLINI